MMSYSSIPDLLKLHKVIFMVVLNFRIIYYEKTHFLFLQVDSLLDFHSNTKGSKKYCIKKHKIIFSLIYTICTFETDTLNFFRYY